MEQQPSCFRHHLSQMNTKKMGRGSKLTKECAPESNSCGCFPVYLLSKLYHLALFLMFLFEKLFSRQVEVSFIFSKQTDTFVNLPRCVLTFCSKQHNYRAVCLWCVCSLWFIFHRQVHTNVFISLFASTRCLWAQ